MCKTILDGIWRFGFQEGACAEPLSIPATTVAAVPGCFDAGELFSRRGFGVYRRTVECGGNVRLSFSGGLNIRVFWDGKEVGSSVLPYTLEHYEFNAGRPGRHELAIVADNRFLGTEEEIFKSYYDFYGYGGIYSHVELEQIDGEAVSRVQVTPIDTTTGTVEIAVEFPDQPRKADITIAFDGGRREKVSYTKPIRRKVPNFKVWSPASPHLHTVTVSRGDDSKTATFGIRTLEWHGGVLKLNGSPVKLLGYCRHESHPDFGAATPPAVIRNDLVKIKQQGCNFIRGSHYPQREEMLDICDEIGLLVWDESMGWNNEENAFTDPEFQRRQVEQTVKMVRNSYNHPSVIIWGFLNELHSETTSARDIVGQLVSAIHANDPGRPATFASNRTVRDLCLDLVDIISFNTYPGWYDPDMPVSGIQNVRPKLKREAKWATEGDFADKPLIISEIGAGAFLGDHSGARWSEEYQAALVAETLKAVYANPRFTGISFWQYCNSRTYIDGQINGRPRGFNNKGVLDEYRRPKMAWFTIQDFANKLFSPRRSAIASVDARKW